MGSGTLTFISPQFYNDDKWHTIEASREGKLSILKIDGELIHTGECNGSETQLQVCIQIVKLIYTFNNKLTSPTIKKIINIVYKNT